MNELLEHKLKYLRFASLREHWDEYLQLGAKKRMSHAKLLERIVQDEYARKRQNAHCLRLKHARIPEPFVLETYPFAKQPKLNKKRVLALYDSSDYLQKGQNIIFLGRTGCGKTGLATSFLIHYIDQGYTGRFVLFTDLLAELYASVADHTEKKLLKRYASYDCLLVDEIGIVEVEPVQVGLFFTLMNNRHRKKSTLLTSNLGFGQWGSFLKNEQLTAALLDRLTATSHVFNMKGCRSLRDPLSASL